MRGAFLYILYIKYISYMKNTQPDDKISTIRVTEKTKKVVEELGNLSETYDSVILKIAEHYKKCRHKNGDK